MEPKVLRAKAFECLNAAKSIRTEFGLNMDAAKKAEFDAFMAEYTVHSQALAAAIALETQFAEMDSALNLYSTPAESLQTSTSDLETVNLNVAGAAAYAAFKADHRKAFVNYAKFGVNGLDMNAQRQYLGGGFTREELSNAGVPEEVWAHLGTVDTLGGFLVPEDFQSELIRDLSGFSVMRRLARIRQTSSHTATFMTVAGSGNRQYTSGVTGSFRSEGWVQGGNNIPTQNEPRFGRERIPVHVWSPDVIEITMELLEDSSISLEQELRAILAETRGLDEDSAFLVGSGIGMPKGLYTEASEGNLSTVNSGAATGQTYAGLVNMWSELPAQYRQNATWTMNSLTQGLLALLEDTVGNPIFPTNEIPMALFGRPIEVSEFIADGNVASARSMIFGNYQFFGIADRMDLRIIRLNERFAPNIGLLAVARVGGQMLRAQPFVSQLVSA